MPHQFYLGGVLFEVNGPEDEARLRAIHAEAERVAIEAPPIAPVEPVAVVEPAAHDDDAPAPKAHKIGHKKK